MIKLSNVTKRFGRKWVLKEISFQIPKKQITCLVGRNGVGKTTIMNMIMGLTHPTKGNITIDGERIHSSLYDNISYVPDQATMLNQMTVGDAMDFMRGFYKNWNDEQALELLYLFSLHKSDRIQALSKGARKKVDILLGLSMDAEYILLDEPFSGVDPNSRKQIIDVCTGHFMENRGILISTHDMLEVEHIVNRAVMIEDGMVHRVLEIEEDEETEKKTIIDMLKEVDAHAERK